MEIPAHSTVSYFDHDEYTITCIASMLSGMEQVYVNDQLVSEKRSFRFKSVHNFMLGEKQASIIVAVSSIFKGPYIIEFWLDGHKVDSDEWNYRRMIRHSKEINANKSMWQVVGTYFIYGMLGGFLGGSLGYLVAIWLKG